jgi:hypothetical protein
VREEILKEKLKAQRRGRMRMDNPSDD